MCRVKYDDLQGIERRDEQIVKVIDGYEGNSIRKQILLVRYVDLIKGITPVVDNSSHRIHASKKTPRRIS